MRISDWSSDVCSSDLVMSEGVDQLRDLVMRTGEFRQVEAIALTAGKPEPWIKRGFTDWKESQSLVFPGGFEMLLAPCGFVAATVHAPIGAPSGVPVPLGFASFDPRIVDRAMAMLAGQAPRFGLRSEEHTSELQSLMRISYAVCCLKKTKKDTYKYNTLIL